MRCGKNYRPAVVFTFWATFKRIIYRPKIDPQLFFLLNLFINGQAFITQKNLFSIIKLLFRSNIVRQMGNIMDYLIYYHCFLVNCSCARPFNTFSLFCKGVQGKKHKIIAILGFTLLIRENNNYETAATYMNPRLQLLVRLR